MPELSEETKKLQAEVGDKFIWITFWSDPRFRRFHCDASKQALDSWLNDQGLELTLDNLVLAADALVPKGKLAANDPTEVSRRRAQEAEKALRTKETAEAEEAARLKAASEANEIPLELDRRAILRMNREDYRVLRAKYGEQRILNRVNFGQ